MEKGIRYYFSCRSCQWGEQCPAPHNEICEHYDSIGELEAEAEEKLMIEIERRRYRNDFLDLLEEIEG